MRSRYCDGKCASQTYPRPNSGRSKAALTTDTLHLAHILECIEKIERFTIEGKQSFAADEKTQDAVLRNLHTLSESSTRVSAELRERYSHVAWQEMRAFRHVVVHDYLGLELDQIWDIIVNDLPPVKQAMLTISKNSDRIFLFEEVERFTATTLLFFPIFHVVNRNVLYCVCKYGHPFGNYE
ncbi:MAG: DUF86 domain-containing protein [Candidatus Kapaibacterium sp.]